MKKFIKKHGKNLITVAVGAGLLATLDWNWSNIKSFFSGGLIAFYVWLIWTSESENA